MGKYAIPATLAFLGAYIAVEAYYAGQRDGQSLVVSEDSLPVDTDKTDSPPESQQEPEE